jgi:hypothetical protein
MMRATNTNRTGDPTPRTIRILSIRAHVDPRSVRRLLRGEPVRPTIRERILEAIVAEGLAHLVPESLATH